ncbi:DUF6264 family protein [Curtobacterium citreum]|uniref:DUF6264 family protein n=1 Tax=Curtobacterium citreum TaxID=2036 RepID=UPI002549F328|nr:DUF6264 family protein [Curtobacterium citreum]MDK8173235.1 DUF6264 family protein [Curtobacterium citreum]
MTWSNVPGGPPQSSPAGGPHDRDARQRAEWARGGTTLFPAGRIADRVSTVLLLVFGAVMTLVTAVVGIVALVSATAGCDAATGCSPGGYLGGTAIAVGGAFVVGVATVVLTIGAWLRRRSSWWIAAIGFVLAIAVITWGGVVFADAADGVGTAGTATAAP